MEAKGRNESALRMRSAAGQVFRYAIAQGLIENDPTFGLKDALKRRERPLQSRRIRRHGERPMPQAHRRELTFAAGAAADHLRTVRMRTNRTRVIAAIAHAESA